MCEFETNKQQLHCSIDTVDTSTSKNNICLHEVIILQQQPRRQRFNEQYSQHQKIVAVAVLYCFVNVRDVGVGNSEKLKPKFVDFQISINRFINRMTQPKESQFRTLWYIVLQFHLLIIGLGNDKQNIIKIKNILW